MSLNESVCRLMFLLCIRILLSLPLMDLAHFTIVTVLTPPNISRSLLLTVSLFLLHLGFVWFFSVMLCLFAVQSLNWSTAHHIQFSVACPIWNSVVYSTGKSSMGTFNTILKKKTALFKIISWHLLLCLFMIWISLLICAWQVKTGTWVPLWMIMRSSGRSTLPTCRRSSTRAATTNSQRHVTHQPMSARSTGRVRRSRRTMDKVDSDCGNFLRFHKHFKNAPVGFVGMRFGVHNFGVLCTLGCVTVKVYSSCRHSGTLNTLNAPELNIRCSIA